MNGERTRLLLRVTTVRAARPAPADIRRTTLEVADRKREHRVSTFRYNSAASDMTIFGLRAPLPSHAAFVRHVLAATAATAGFGLGSWLLQSPLDRPGAVALFVGLLYVWMADPFLAMQDRKGKRYAVAASGAGILIAFAAIMEQITTF